MPVNMVVQGKSTNPVQTQSESAGRRTGAAGTRVSRSSLYFSMDLDFTLTFVDSTFYHVPMHTQLLSIEQREDKHQL
jgi:hypothetical protein